MQVCLTELADTLEASGLKKLVERLNRPNSGRLPTMWELVFLRGIARVGALRHEEALPNGRQPDFELDLAGDAYCLTLVGEIATVSDSGLDEKNPIELLRREISRLARKYRLNPDHFRCDVRGGNVGSYEIRRMVLSLPKPQELLQLIKQRIEPFIRELSQTASAVANYEHNDGEAVFTITYDKAQRYAGSSHPAYDAALSLTNNPVYRALKGKVDQIASAPDDWVRLIILCDGDCATMRSDGLFPMTFGTRAIAQEFLRQHSSVDLVLLTSVRSDNFDWRSRKLQLGFELVVSQLARSKQRLTDQALAAVHGALERAVLTLPRPVREPVNAARRCLERGYGIGMAGGYVKTKTIKISSRALLELLAGRISSDRFLELHGWNAGNSNRFDINLFKRALESGRMIKAIHVESGGDKDDDWLEFEFGAPDAAISPFVAPGISTTVTS